MKSSALPFTVQVFDLKGSLRNRKVKTDSGKESCEVVLLDENLLKLIHDNPLYIRSHCKSILRAAIHSDAYFLSSHLIIDYSLLVGRDDASDQLVVGIIGKVGPEVEIADPYRVCVCVRVFLSLVSCSVHKTSQHCKMLMLRFHFVIFVVAPALQCFSLQSSVQITSGHLPGTKNWRWSSNPLEFWEVKVRVHVLSTPSTLSVLFVCFIFSSG